MWKWIFLCMVLLITGCRVTAGVVVDKQYTPAHESVEIVEIINLGDMPVYGTETVYHPATWHITLEDEEESRSTIRVSETTYNKAKLENWFDLNEE